MEKIKCLCGEEFLDNDCFVSHWRECSSSALSDGLCLRLLKELKAETNEYLKDYIWDVADDLDGKTNDLLVARLGDFFDRKIYDVERKA